MMKGAEELENKTIQSSAEDDSLDISAQLKASFKKNSDGTESLELTGRASAGISIIRGGTKESRQGDHLITHALPKYGTIKDFQNLKLDEIEDLSAYLRDKRGILYDFISAIAVLDVKRKDSLYKKIDTALDDYNESRFKIQKIKKLEESVIKNIPKEEQADFFENFQKQRASNGRTMIDAVGRIAEAVMTFYNKTPLTAFLQVEGFEDAAGSGAKVNPILDFIDNFEVSKDKFTEKYLKNEREAINKAQKLLDNATARQKPGLEKSAIESKGILEQKEITLDADFLRESMSRISGLFFYPEITDSAALIKHSEQSGNKDRVRDNSQENLQAAIAKYIHVLTSIYPELPEKLFNLSDKGKIWDEGKVNKKDEALVFLTHKFTEHLITSPYQSKSGEHLKGWPSFANELKIQEISSNTLLSVYTYKELQKEHSYQNTDGYRSRASSGAEDAMKEQILTPVIDFIQEHFGLEEDGLESLVKQLNDLDLAEKSTEVFNAEVMGEIEEYCEKNQIENDLVINIKSALFQEPPTKERDR